MAKNENKIKVRALVNITYDENSFKIGEDFNVRVMDAQELEERCFVEVLEDLITQENEEEIKEGES